MDLLNTLYNGKIALRNYNKCIFLRINEYLVNIERFISCRHVDVSTTVGLYALALIKLSFHRHNNNTNNNNNNNNSNNTI